MAATKPKKLTLRAYQVGFGDCFLLTFHYPKFDRHVLVDFGSTGQPKSAGDKLMLRVAKDIASECGGKLHAVIATHRHRDHISGFSTQGGKNASGTIIAQCDPDVVVQPWTEHPDADPKTGKLKPSNKNEFAFTSALQDMHELSAAVLVEADRRKSVLGPRLHQQLTFLGEDNLTNASAVKNLMEMGRGKNKQGKNKKAQYVHYGSKSGLESVLPGIKTIVLGPPTLAQSEEIRTMRSKDEDEFWHFQAMAGNFVSKRNSKTFRGAPTYAAASMPPATRWFIERMKGIRGEQMLSIMRALDKVMNNTSLILLFQIGKKKLLFPGDAQIENWSYALSKAKDKKLLADVGLYKVGHHGSLNATPKTLWNLFKNRSTKAKNGRLQTVVSTMAGKHGSPPKTEVPRQPLVAALKKESDFFTTQDLKGAKNIRKDFVITF